MSWFKAADALRREAASLRQGNRVSAAQRQATFEALKIFAPEGIDAIKNEWIAAHLELVASYLERQGRDDHTPQPVKTT